MKKNYLRCTIDNKDYIIFLDSETLGCHLKTLKKLKFNKDKVIVDCLFHAGCQNNRFAEFDVKEHKVVINSCSQAFLSESIVKRINDIITLYANDLCELYLSYSDKKIFSECLDSMIRMDHYADWKERYLVCFSEYSNIIGSGETESSAYEEAKDNLKVFLEYVHDIKLNIYFSD